MEMKKSEFDDILTAAIILSVGDTDLSSFAAGFKEACKLLEIDFPGKVPKRMGTAAGAAILLIFMEESKRHAIERTVDEPLLFSLAKEIERFAREACGDTEKIAEKAKKAMEKDMKFKRKKNET